MVNSFQCWYCMERFEYEGDVYQDTNCSHCGTQNSIYNPAEYIPIKPEEIDLLTELKPEEDKMIPEKVQDSQFSPFIKLPNPLKNEEGEIKKDESVVITSEFTAPSSPKIKSALMGLVKLKNGEERTIGINWNTYYNLAKTLGKDTVDWVGREITYKGLVQFEKGTGHLWVGK